MNDAEHEKLVKALREALSDTQNPGERPLLVQRIPFICEDIRTIKNDLRWMKWLGGGFVTAAGMLALKALGI